MNSTESLVAKYPDLKKYTILHHAETIATNGTTMNTEPKNPALEGLERAKEQAEAEIQDCKNALATAIATVNGQLTIAKSRLKKIEKAIKSLS